jgi:hypothetical protein
MSFRRIASPILFISGVCLFSDWRKDTALDRSQSWAIDGCYSDLFTGITTLTVTMQASSILCELVKLRLATPLPPSGSVRKTLNQNFLNAAEVSLYFIVNNERYEVFIEHD